MGKEEEPRKPARSIVSENVKRVCTRSKFIVPLFPRIEKKSFIIIILYLFVWYSSKTPWISIAWTFSSTWHGWFSRRLFPTIELCTSLSYLCWTVTKMWKTSPIDFFFDCDETPLHKNYFPSLMWTPGFTDCILWRKWLWVIIKDSSACSAPSIFLPATCTIHRGNI